MAMFEILMGLLVGVVLLAIYLVYKYAYAPFQFLKRYGIKGPAPTPFLGNYKGRVSMNAMEYDRQLVDKYGPVCGYYIGQQGYIMVSDLDMLKQILVKDFDNFSDHSAFPNFFSDEEEVRDIFSSKGSSWRNARRILSPSFSASKLKAMLPLIKIVTDNLVEVMGQKVDSGESFEVFEVYTKFALEAILATAFGRRCDIQKGESDEFSKIMLNLTDSFSGGQLEQFLIFNSHFPGLMGLMKFFISYTETGKSLETLKKLTFDLIKIRRESGQKEKYKDILQLMIEATGEEEEEEGGGEVERETAPPSECPAHQEAATKPKKGIMSDSEVFQNSFAFLGAGNDTLAATLAFTSYLLALHPDVQEKLQSEIDAYFDEKPESNLYTAAQEITYVDQVLQETMRLYPPAIVTDRYCNKTTIVNGVTIPEGAVVTIPISLLHHSTKYWKDPETFDPERFTAEEKASRPPMCHMPFGYGPRSCIGMRLALLETRIVLIELFKKYTFIRAPDTEVPPKLPVGLILKPKNGIHLKVINRP